MTNKAAPKPKVCMVAHTMINRDARVCRAAQALLETGCEVSLICLGNPAEPRIPRQVRAASLHFIPNLSLLNRLRKRRIGRDGNRRRSFRLGGLPLALLARPPLRYAFFSAAGLLMILRERPRILHCHDLNVLPLGGIAKLLFRSRIVYDSHEIFTEKAGLRWRPFWKLVERVLVRFCDDIICTTQARSEVMQKLYPKISPPIVVHNYPERYKGPQMEIRQAAGLPQDAFVALYQGGVQALRGLEQLVACAPLLESDNIFIVIQGDGPSWKRLGNLIENAPGKEQIRLLPGGTYDSLRSFTASADVGLQTLQPGPLNHATALSNKLFEYLQAGLAIVAADLPMIGSFLTKHQCGILVDSTAPASIAEALSRLHRDRELLRDLRERARAAVDEVDWEREKLKLIDLYKRKAKAGRAPLA